MIPLGRETGDWLYQDMAPYFKRGSFMNDQYTLVRWLITNEKILTNQITGFPNLLFLIHFKIFPFFSQNFLGNKSKKKIKNLKRKKLELNLTISDDVIACKWIRRCFVRGRANIVRCWSHRLNIQKIKKLQNSKNKREIH